MVFCYKFANGFILNIKVMKKKVVSTEIDCLGYDELSDAESRLAELARQATKRSYAPYSKFHVGAAIELENGRIIEGANQENAAFPSGTCAERSACYYASAAHPGIPFKRIAIAAHSIAPGNENLPWEENFTREPISPCGACRQALLEYENLYGPIEVLLCGKEQIYRLPSVASLLPLCFKEF